MFVQVGNIQFAVEHLMDKSLKDAQIMFKNINPLTVKKAFDLANKSNKKRSDKK